MLLLLAMAIEGKVREVVLKIRPRYYLLYPLVKKTSMKVKIHVWDYVNFGKWGCCSTTGLMV